MKMLSIVLALMCVNSAFATTYWSPDKGYVLADRVPRDSGGNRLDA